MSTDPELLARSEAYLDRLFGEGMGRRHTRFLEGVAHPGLRDALHRYHVLEDDEAVLSVQENYLIGMCVLYAQGRHGPASMFAKTLLHLGTPAPKLLEAIARLEMWVGGIAAAEAMAHLQRAVSSYEARGLDAMEAWFPPEGGDGR